MESDRFDALTARLATPLSRRRSVGLLGMLGLGSLVAADDTEARKRKHKKHKKKPKLTCGAGTKVCGRECIPTSSCCGSCPNGGVCLNGACNLCTSEQTRCGDACVDLATDPENCGTCGRTCPSGDCRNGTCTCDARALCPSGCSCTSDAKGYAACSGNLTSTPCVDYACGLGKACTAGTTNLCTTTC